jgi:octaprenyl-diphosphate synthase
MFGAQSSQASRPVASAHDLQIAHGWKQLVTRVDPFLSAVAERLAAQVKEFDPDIAAYAQYALTAQGKQLRPILVALAAEAFGRIEESHVKVASIIEMVHLATLVHDDVMDGAEFRRSRPTLAVRWGTEISVLVGDCLFAQALKLAASFPTPDICRAVASATNTVCSGEILQTQRRRNFEVSLAEYFRMLAMKTAELFALSCELGARLSNASENEEAALRQFGLDLGTAYQLYDDCVDLFGQEKVVGKSLGTDLAKGKLTLPIFIVLDHATAEERQEIRGCVDNWKVEYWPRIQALLGKYQALAQSKVVIDRYLAAARRTLAGLPPSEGRDGLAGLTRFLEQQILSLGVVSA